MVTVQPYARNAVAFFVSRLCVRRAPFSVNGEDVMLSLSMASTITGFVPNRTNKKGMANYAMPLGANRMKIIAHIQDSR